MATQCKIRKAAWIHEVYALRQESSSPENVATRSPNQAKLRSKTRHQISHTKMNRRLLPVFKIHADAIQIPRRFAHESVATFSSEPDARQPDIYARILSLNERQQSRDYILSRYRLHQQSLTRLEKNVKAVPIVNQRPF